jgi:hypothetical protein
LGGKAGLREDLVRDLGVGALLGGILGQKRKRREKHYPNGHYLDLDKKYKALKRKNPLKFYSSSFHKFEGAFLFRALFPLRVHIFARIAQSLTSEYILTQSKGF